jgi:mRNA interferase MazF
LVLADTGDLDIVVARMTSVLPRDQFDVEVIDWLTAGLLLPSMTRTHKLVTVEKRTVERRLGMLSEVDWARVQESIERLLIRR